MDRNRVHRLRVDDVLLRALNCGWFIGSEMSDTSHLCATGLSLPLEMSRGKVVHCVWHVFVDRLNKHRYISCTASSAWRRRHKASEAERMQLSRVRAVPALIYCPSIRLFVVVVVIIMLSLHACTLISFAICLSRMHCTDTGIRTPPADITPRISLP